ncbi:hypothetical protein Tco_0961739, partial [Tanacetum coccineum]
MMKLEETSGEEDIYAKHDAFLEVMINKAAKMLALELNSGTGGKDDADDDDADDDGDDDGGDDGGDDDDDDGDDDDAGFEPARLYVALPD